MPAEFTGEQKLRIVLESIIRGVPRDDQCKKYGITSEQFQTWQAAISIRIQDGLVAQNPAESSATAVYDPKTNKAYFEDLAVF